MPTVYAAMTMYLILNWLGDFAWAAGKLMGSSPVSLLYSCGIWRVAIWIILPPILSSCWVFYNFWSGCMSRVYPPLRARGYPIT